MTRSLVDEGEPSSCVYPGNNLTLANHEIIANHEVGRYQKREHSL